MVAVEKKEGYTPEQISDTVQLIKILVGLPEDKRELFTAIVTAYIDGVETGTRIARNLESVTV